MEHNFLPLKKCPLFAGIAQTDMGALLDCLHATELQTEKGSLVFAAGDRPDYVGVVLEGAIHIVQEDYWGNRSILTAVHTGGLFGEAFSCAGAAAFPVSALVHERGRILLIDCTRIFSGCASACTFHTRLIRNLMKILANKNILLTRKIEHITKKTTQEKLLSYLSECAAQAGTNSFSIPFNRQELADYLSVERSALSGTLSKMRREGLIQFEKNKFVLL